MIPSTHSYSQIAISEPESSDANIWKAYNGKSNEVCFTFVNVGSMVGVRKVTKYRCKICKFVSTCKNDSTYVKRHLKTRHNRADNNREPFHAWKEREPGLGTVSLQFPIVKKYDGNHKQQRIFVRKCAKWIAKNKRSFTIVEDDGFCYVLGFLNPRVNTVTRG